MDGLEFKSAVGGVKVLDEGNGIVQAIVSVTNVVDNVKDNILPGAYRETLSKRVPKGLRGHDWNRMVAKTLHAEELMPGDPRVREIAPKVYEKGGGGLLIRGQYNLNTQVGRDAYEDAKFFGDEMEWSVGYKVPAGKSAIVPKTGVREIKAMDLYEWSDVAFGAAPLTAGTTSVKSAIVGMIEEGVLDRDEILEWAELAGIQSIGDVELFAEGKANRGGKNQYGGPYGGSGAGGTRTATQGTEYVNGRPVTSRSGSYDGVDRRKKDRRKKQVPGVTQRVERRKGERRTRSGGANRAFLPKSDGVLGALEMATGSLPAQSKYAGLEAECEDCGCGCEDCLTGKTLHMPGDDGFETKVRKVRSAEGSRRYGLPIGTPLGRAKPKPPKGARRRRGALGGGGGGRGGGGGPVASRSGDGTTAGEGGRRISTSAGSERTGTPVGGKVPADTPDTPDANTDTDAAPNLDPTELPESIQNYELSKAAQAAIRDLNPDYPGLSKMGPPDLVTDDVDEALEALAEGKNVELKQPKQVSSLLNRLVDVVNDAKKRDKQARARWEAGDNDPALYDLAQKAKADPQGNMQKFLDAGGKTEQLDDVETIPDYNLCGISVKGTNLFCAQHKDKTRLTMPQLAGKPRPGSKAEKILEEQNAERKRVWDEEGREGNWEDAGADAGGPTNEVDLAGHFRDYLLNELEIETSQEKEKAANLKASQRELVGANVAGMMLSMMNTDENGEPIDPAKRHMPPGRIFISEDDYVLDGHHRWAAAVGQDLADNVEGDIDMDVERVPLPVMVLLKIATDWSTEMGVPPKGGGKGSAGESVAQATAQAGKKDDDPLSTLLKVLGFEGDEDGDLIPLAFKGGVDGCSEEDLIEAVRDELAQINEEFGGELDDDDLPWIYDRVVEAVATEISTHGGGYADGGEKIVGAAAIVSSRRGRGIRKVRTTSGARFYGQPIGSVIKPGAGGRKPGTRRSRPPKPTGRGRDLGPHPLAPKPAARSARPGDPDTAALASTTSVTRRGGATFVYHTFAQLETERQAGLREQIRAEGGLRKSFARDLNFLATILLRSIMGRSNNYLALQGASDTHLEDTMQTKTEWTAEDAELADQLHQLSEEEWGLMVDSLHDGDSLDKVKAICDQVEFELKGLDPDDGDYRALYFHHWLQEFDLKWDDPSVPDEELIAAADGLEVKAKGHSSRVHPGLDRSPKENWVDKAGGLPSYIERIAKHLHSDRGMTISRAIATAISRVKKWAAGGDNVSAATRAKAAKALAQWEKMKASTKAKRKDDDLDLEEKRDYSSGKRKEMEDEGAAMPGGRYPIKTAADLKNAIQAFGRGAPDDKAAIKAHIKKRARALGLEDQLPDSWKEDSPLDVLADLFPDLDLKMKKHRFMGKGGGKCAICKLGMEEGKHIGASEPNKESSGAAEARDEKEEDEDDKGKGKGKGKWVPPWKKSLEEMTEQDVIEMAQLVDDWYEGKAEKDKGQQEEDEGSLPDDDIDDGPGGQAANDPNEGPRVQEGIGAPGMGGPTDTGDTVDEDGDGDAAKALALLLDHKAGRVLSGSNAAAVRSAMDQLVTVLKKAGVDLSDLIKDEKKKPETADQTAGDEEGVAAEDGSPFAASGAKRDEEDGLVTISIAELMEAAELRLTADV